MGLILCLAAVFILLLDLCAGARMVSIQKGRLYRARGYHITIWCNVSGYLGPLEQNFQWSIYFPSAPEREIQMISTSDPSFPYAIYSQRVKSGKFYIERIQGDSVLLHITELQDQDAGKYECHTPNTDGIYLGTYSAKMDLSVIPDTLSATMKPQALIRNQGDSLELTCEVSTATAQHTHLSVAWYLLQGDRDGQAHKIVSLSRDFVLVPGSSYTQRFSSGDIRLDKIGSTMYKLSIVKVQPLDQGEVYCEAVEWIQDPDESWKDIARKQTDRTSLTIRSLDNNIYVNISAAKTSLLEGEVFQISCFVQGQNIQYRWYQLVWLHHSMVVANIDQYGALVFQKNYEDRGSMGNLLVMKQSYDKYILRINEVELNDKGTYSCKVSEIEKTPTGSFTMAEQRSSSGINIQVKPRESNLKLFIWVNEPHTVEGETLIFHCNVSTADNSLSVNWWHIQEDRDPPVLIASMAKDGRLRIGASYLERSTQGDLRVQKVDPFTFTLTIYNTSATMDTGLYRCEVTEWDTHRSWKAAQEISTKVEPLGLKLNAVVYSRTPNVKLHEDFALNCKVNGNHITNKVPISITWQFQPGSKLDGYQQVVKVTAGGNIEWGVSYLHFQKRTKITKTFYLSQLQIHSATWQDAGTYKCEVEVWRTFQQARDLALVSAAAVSSNPVEIKITNPENKLQIEGTNHSVTVTENEDVTLKCIMQGPKQLSSRFSITWFKVSAQSHTELLVTIKDNGLIEYNSRKMARRLHLHGPVFGDFRLTLQNVEVADAGTFYCVVEEWHTVNCNTARVSNATGQSGFSRLVVLPSVSTNSSQICYSPSLFYFISCYPLVLILIVVAVFLFLRFRTKLVTKKNLNPKKKQDFWKEAEIEPAHFKLSEKGSNDTAEDETNNLTDS